MKKLFTFFVVCMLSVYAFNASARTTSSLQQEIARVGKHLQEEQTAQKLHTLLHTWATKGNAQAFADFAAQAQAVRQNNISCPVGYILVSLSEKEPVPGCIKPAVLLKKDAFHNNLLHNAKDLPTVSAVGSFYRFFFPSDFTLINKLKNEKNIALETPLIAHVSRGDLNAFFPLYEGSNLEIHINKMENVFKNKQSLLWQSSGEIIEQEIAQWGTNAAGTNIVQLIKLHPQHPQAAQLIRFFSVHAPYLM